MLKHGRAGVPMEVMGLMLSEFVDEYTVNVIDVFAMPQSGTGVSVEAVDPVFQAKMLDMLKQTGRSEMEGIVVSNDMSSVSSLAALDHTHLKWDKEWMFHKLPKDSIEIPRHHLPNPAAKAIPGTSKQVHMVVALIRYLKKQGIEFDEISTVIAAYSPQMMALRETIGITFGGLREDQSAVSVQTIDSYQGKVDFISDFGKSHINNVVGEIRNGRHRICSVKNRITVALRAKHGMYVVGNFGYLSHCSSFWDKICDKMFDNDLISTSMKIKYKTHGNVQVQLVTVLLLVSGVEVEAGYIPREEDHPIMKVQCECREGKITEIQNRIRHQGNFSGILFDSVSGYRNTCMVCECELYGEDEGIPRYFGMEMSEVKESEGWFALSDFITPSSFDSEPHIGYVMEVNSTCCLVHWQHTCGEYEIHAPKSLLRLANHV